MSNPITLINTEADITAEWMTNVLRNHGSLTDEQSVTEMDVVSLGEQAGLLGLLYRTTMTYSEGATGPASTVIKIPTDDPAQRGVADMLGFYNRECTFYNERAQTTSFRTADIYGMVAPEGESTDFVLVMEDLGHLAQVDQVAGASIDAVDAAVVGIAKQHARYWEHEDIPSLADPFLRIDGPIYHAALPQVFAGGWDAAKAHGTDILTPEVTAFGDRFGELVPSMLATLGSPTTLVHGDFRGDNLMFDEDGALSIIDFQITGTGHGAYDIAYFMSQSLEPDLRKANDERVVRLYVDTLNAAGIDVNFDDVMHAYRVGLAFCLIYAVTSFQAWEAFDGRQHELMLKMLSRSTQAMTDNDSLSLLSM